MKQFFLILLAISALSFQSCKKIKGDGPVVTEYRNVSNFRSVNNSIDGDLHFTPGNSYNVEIRAQQNILDIIEARTSNGELKIRYDGNYNIGRHDRIDIYVTCPSPNGFTISGSGNIDVTRALDVSDMRLRIAGSGAINLNELVANDINASISGSGDINVSAGKANTASYQIDGSGSIDLLDVVVKDVMTTTRGSGNTRVHATDNLDVNISGSGDVIYKGNPHINTRISGSGNVRRW